jgi:gas vesicle protein
MDDKANPVTGGGATTPKPAQELRAQIADTRNHMSSTIEELHGRLNPVVLKDAALEQFHDASDTIKSELKSHLADAKEAMRSELAEARTALKREVREELHNATAAVREATIGKVEHMMDGARDKVRTTTTSMMDTVRANPIPAAMIGAGLAWLFFGGRKDRQHREARQYRDDRSMYGDIYSRGYQGGAYDAYPDDFGGDTATSSAPSGARELMSNAGRKVSDVAHGAVAGVGHLAHDAGAAVSNAARGVGESVSHLAHGARDQIGAGAQRVGAGVGAGAQWVGRNAAAMGHTAADGARRVQTRGAELYETNPLAIGAVAVALGAVVALAAPRTDLEDRYMGGARDQLTDRAQQFAHEAISKVESAASHAAESMSDTSRDNNSNRPNA